MTKPTLTQRNILSLGAILGHSVKTLDVLQTKYGWIPQNKTGIMLYLLPFSAVSFEHSMCTQYWDHSIENEIDATFNLLTGISSSFFEERFSELRQYNSKFDIDRILDLSKNYHMFNLSPYLPYPNNYDFMDAETQMETRTNLLYNLRDEFLLAISRKCANKDGRWSKYKLVTAGVGSYGFGLDYVIPSLQSVSEIMGEELRRYLKYFEELECIDSLYAETTLAYQNVFRVVAEISSDSDT